MGPQPPHHVLGLMVVVSRLHATYRRLIPAIEVSLSHSRTPSDKYNRVQIVDRDPGRRRDWSAPPRHDYGDENSGHSLSDCLGIHPCQAKKLDDVRHTRAISTLVIFLKTLTSSRGLDADAQDISYALSRYWNRVDINRIPEQDMNQFVSRNTAAAPAWSAVKRKYRA